MLDKYKCIGKGSYGYVTLVKKKETNDVRAMKVISKRNSKNPEKENEQMKREVNIHKNLAHPNIIQLLDYFEDTQNLYLIMEYAENGNLWKLMKKQ